ncbi:hypothetical protein BKA81DRAFT_372145 [Phyllosticta paracitricarpa]|uniref:Uncharacterized protein n=1 Tax=Phyllosticta paracitricarpa TaxID=2016321 RepID=A0ABR1MTJ0_9PEZI
MGSLDALTTEVERVVSSPYAVSLKKLHDILLECDSATIRTWALSSRCVVYPLAKCAREALQLWPYTLQIIQKLALAPPFRDEFLKQDPSILDSLLREVTSSGNAKMSETCIALLSEPLPAFIPLPSSAQDFFIQTFEKSVQFTNEENVSNVYTLLDGSCRELLSLLPEEFLDHFEERSYRFLKEKGTTGKELESYRMQILYLGILATLLEPRSRRKSQHSDPSSQASRSSSASRSFRSGSMEEIVRVFKGSAAHSTVNWITTMVLRICATGTRDFDDSALRSLKIAIEVLMVIPSEIRQSYVEHKESSKFVGKLIEKAMKLTANPVVQVQGLAMVGLLHEQKPIPKHVTRAYSKAVIAAGPGMSNLRLLLVALGASWPYYSPYFEEDFIKDLLRQCITGALDLSTSGVELGKLRILIDLLNSVLLECAPVRKGILLALAADDFRPCLQKFLANPAPQSNATTKSDKSCLTFALEQGRLLSLGICSTILRAALFSQSDEIGMEAQIATQLMQKQIEFAAPLSACKHDMMTEKSGGKISLFQQACTPRTQPESHDWRGRLATDLQSQDRLRMELIERRVGEVCRDLETRCETVEEPLRVEKQRNQDLQAEIHRLHEQNLDLVTQASELEEREIDRELCMQGLENEKSQVEVELKTACERNDTLEERLQELQGSMEKAIQRAEETLDSVRQDFDRKEADLRALLITTETAAEEKDSEIQLLRSHAEMVEADLQDKTQTITDEKMVKTELEKKLELTLRQLEEERELKGKSEAEKSELNQSLQGLRSEGEALTEALREARATIDRLEAEHKTQIATMIEEMETLRQAGESELQKTRDEAKFTQGSLQAQMQTAKDEISKLVQKQEVDDQELQSRDEKIVKLQGEIRTFKETLSETKADLADAENELEQAQVMKERLMNAMGFGQESNARQSTRRSLVRASTVNVPTTPGRKSRRRTFKDTDFGSEADEYGDIPGSQLSDSPQSPGMAMDDGDERHCSGPTPKRAKPRRGQQNQQTVPQQPFKVPTLKPSVTAPAKVAENVGARRRSSRISSGRLPAEMDSMTQRKPLKDVSLAKGNLSPQRRPADGGRAGKSVVFEKVEGEEKKFGTEDITVGSFDASELLDATPFTPSGKVTTQREQMEEDVGDETTAEL